MTNCCKGSCFEAGVIAAKQTLIGLAIVLTAVFATPVKLWAAPSTTGISSLPQTDAPVAKHDGLQRVHCCHAHPRPPFDPYCCHAGATVYVAPVRPYVGSVRRQSRRVARRTARRVRRRR